MGVQSDKRGSPHHQFLELFEGDPAVVVEVGLLDHIADVFVGHFGLAHLRQHFLEALEGHCALLVRVQHFEARNYVLLRCDSQHHSASGEGYLAMRDKN